MRIRLLLLAAFIAVPLLEIYVLIQVGQVIGAWWTIAALIAVSVLGSWLIRREGRRAWRALTEATSTGRLPNRELLDGGLILVGGVLMLTPGFVSDVAGLFLIMPPTRPFARRAATWLLGRQLARQVQRGGHLGGGHLGGMRGMPGMQYPPGRPKPGDQGVTIPGEVVDRDDRP
jgi:UPF0716 protein FxsA